MVSYVLAPTKKVTPPQRVMPSITTPAAIRGIPGVGAAGQRGGAPNLQAQAKSQTIERTDPLTSYQDKLRQNIEQGERFNSQLEQLRNNRRPQTKTGFKSKYALDRRYQAMPVNNQRTNGATAVSRSNGAPPQRGASGLLRPDQLARSYGGALVIPQASNGLMQLGRAFEQAFGKPLKITDSYRSYDAQVRTKAAKGRMAAAPGKSNHGWGRALDLGSGANKRGSREYNWMMQNAPRYGFVNPRWAQTTKIEPWHWEFVG